MNWFFDLLFPPKRGTTRMRPNPLPGIKPPQSPRQPPLPLNVPKSDGPSIEEMYARFLSEGGGKSKPTKRKGDGLF